MGQSLLSFSIGPVQEFIAAARTTRDLWTGSYLLSWLTAHAMYAVEVRRGEFLSPFVGQKNPLYDAVCRKQAGEPLAIQEAALLACLPNTFVARFDSSPSATDAARACEEAVRSEWAAMTGAVHDFLTERAKNWKGTAYPWHGWREQTENYWDLRVVVVPADLDERTLRRFVQNRDLSEFQVRYQYAGKLAAAQKLIRHYPPHEFYDTGDGTRVADTRPKCSLVGTFAQMGPVAASNESQMTRTRDFWDDFRGKAHQPGTRLGERDRFCAISLAKRFAWSTYFVGKCGFDPEWRRYSDINTICCTNWLETAKQKVRLDIGNTKQSDGRVYWSGHWLRWKAASEEELKAVADKEGEERPDWETWAKIQTAKQKQYAGPPPTYYAVLLLDGDDMGRHVQTASAEIDLRQLTFGLAAFTMTEVSPVVEAQNRGTLVYAGGDDLLAFVPTTNALACATKLNEAFRRVATSMEFLKDDKVTCSAAVTVAHYKTPLRIVLNEARVAERRAKDAGRDCLTIATLRRSGELSTAVIPWSSVPNLERFVCDFKDSPDRVTDRWAYQFRRQLELMPSDQPEIWRAELLRILKHAERMSEDFRKRVLDFWDAQVKGDFPGEQPARERAIEFVQVIQAASFLARGARE